MQHKSVTSPYSKLIDYPESPAWTSKRLKYELDALSIDLFELQWFLWIKYQPLIEDRKDKSYQYFKDAFKRCPDCQHVWFISAKRDKAWKFKPTQETRAALSKPLIEFLDYPIENDLRFINNKKIIHKIITEDKEDTVYFDLLFGEIVEHPREGFDWDIEWQYDKFNPLQREYDFLSSDGGHNCKYCGTLFIPKRTNMDLSFCCSSKECLKKRFSEQRRLNLSGKKKLREKNNIENPKRCLNCHGILVETARPNQKFCGLNCRVSYHRKKKLLD
jgi:hypothetical protein